MNKFRKVLFYYGAYILTQIYKLAIERELYEDCRQIKDLFDEFDLDINMTQEDWQAEFWRKRYSGYITIANQEDYLKEALEEVGYGYEINKTQT